MARSRNIKPGLCSNEDLAECSIPARYLFACIPMLADREGRLEDRSGRIKMQIFPADNIDVEALILELTSHGNPRFLIRYEIDGKRYIQITGFTAHQTPHYSEKKSVIKPPNIQDIIANDERINPGNIIPSSHNDSRTSPEISEKQGVIKGGGQPPDSLIHRFSDSPIPDSPIPDSPIPDSPIPDSPIPDSPIPKTNSKTLRATSEKNSLAGLMALGVSEQSAKDWMIVRKAKKAPLTQTVIDSLVSEAAKAGITVAEAVRIAAERSWQGFKADWLIEKNGNGANGKSRAQIVQEQNDCAMAEWLAQGENGNLIEGEKNEQH